MTITKHIDIRPQQLRNIAASFNFKTKYLRKEVDKFKNAAMQAREAYVKLRKERDYHRMHHRRVVQEKNKLITDIKRLKVSQYTKLNLF